MLHFEFSNLLLFLGMYLVPETHTFVDRQLQQKMLGISLKYPDS